tara:strand:- start:5119 stop:5880 length:762 start_codon:yes stop_codon:yes gene_type:complete
MNKLKFIPIIGIPEIKSGDNIPKILNKELVSNKINLKDNDILVLTQKIVSKAENRIINLDSIKPKSKAIKLGKELNKNPKLVQLILDESKSIIKIDKNRGIIITETKLGHICANSGIDSSNIYGGNNVSLLPKDPDKSAKFIFKNLIQDHKIENLGIIISDTFGRPWRVGQTNISIGSYGITPLIDYQNNTDAFGKKLNTTKICIVDELSGGAEILMEKALKIPIVLIRGVKFQFSVKGSKEILREKNLDLFR